MVTGAALASAGVAFDSWPYWAINLSLCVTALINYDWTIE